MTVRKDVEASHEYLLGRIDGKLDLVLANLAKSDARIDVVESDVQTLKQGRSWLLGAAAALGTASSAVAAVLFRG